MRGLSTFREVLRLRELAQSCAKDAAPYCHPRLATIAGPEGDPIKLDAIEVVFVRPPNRERVETLQPPALQSPPTDEPSQQELLIRPAPGPSVPPPSRGIECPSCLYVRPSSTPFCPACGKRGRRA